MENTILFFGLPISQRDEDSFIHETCQVIISGDFRETIPLNHYLAIKSSIWKTSLGNSNVGRETLPELNHEWITELWLLCEKLNIKWSIPKWYLVMQLG